MLLGETAVNCTFPRALIPLVLGNCSLKAFSQSMPVYLRSRPLMLSFGRHSWHTCPTHLALCHSTVVGGGNWEPIEGIGGLILYWHEGCAIVYTAIFHVSIANMPVATGNKWWVEYFIGILLFPNLLFLMHWDLLELSHWSLSLIYISSFFIPFSKEGI